MLSFTDDMACIPSFHFGSWFFAFWASLFRARMAVEVILFRNLETLHWLEIELLSFPRKAQEQLCRPRLRSHFPFEIPFELAGSDLAHFPTGMNFKHDR
jgi:hypothetical protein